MVAKKIFYYNGKDLCADCITISKEVWSYTIYFRGDHRYCLKCGDYTELVRRVIEYYGPRRTAVSTKRKQSAKRDD